MHHVLSRYDRRIDQHADRNGDPRQRHDVRLDVGNAQAPQDPHDHKRRQGRKRQRHRDDERRAEVHQHQDDADRGGEHRFDEGRRDGAHGPLDQRRALVSGDDLHSRRQSGVELGDLGLQAPRHFERILAVAHQHDPTHDFVSVLFENSPPRTRPQRHPAQFGYSDDAAIGRGDENVLEIAEHLLRIRLGFRIGGRAQPANSPYDVFGVPLVDDLSPDGGVRAGQFSQDGRQLDSFVAHFQRVEIDMVFEHLSADAGDLGHAGHRFELMLYEPVLNVAQFAQIVAAPLDGVPEYLAGRDGVGGEPRRHTGGQHILEAAQPLENACAGRRELDAVFEDQPDHRRIDVTRTADNTNSGQALQIARQGIRDLVFDLAGAVTRPFGEHDRLVFREIGDGVHRGLQHGEDAADRQREAGENHQAPVSDRDFNQAIDHLLPFVCILKLRPNRLTAARTRAPLRSFLPKSACADFQECPAGRG